MIISLNQSGHRWHPHLDKNHRVSVDVNVWVRVLFVFLILTPTILLCFIMDALKIWRYLRYNIGLNGRKWLSVGFFVDSGMFSHSLLIVMCYFLIKLEINFQGRKLIRQKTQVHQHNHRICFEFAGLLVWCFLLMMHRLIRF